MLASNYEVLEYSNWVQYWLHYVTREYFSYIRPLVFIVTKAHNTWVVTERQLTARGHHSSLWPKGKTFEILFVGTVCCWPKVTTIEKIHWPEFLATLVHSACEWYHTRRSCRNRMTLSTYYLDWGNNRDKLLYGNTLFQE